MGDANNLVTGEVRDATGARLGMWLFILSEILLFGGLFILYSAYRYKNPVDFHHASRELDVILGTLNTIILLTSSFSMAASISAIQRSQRKVVHGPAHSDHGSWPFLSREQGL